MTQAGKQGVIAAHHRPPPIQLGVVCGHLVAYCGNVGHIGLSWGLLGPSQGGSWGDPVGEGYQKRFFFGLKKDFSLDSKKIFLSKLTVSLRTSFDFLSRDPLPALPPGTETSNFVKDILQFSLP